MAQCWTLLLHFVSSCTSLEGKVMKRAPSRFGLSVMCFAMACVSSAGLYSAEAPLPVVRVCEVLRDLPSYGDKAVAVVGRFSYREAGRFLSEKMCDSTKSESHPDPAAILVVYDSKSAPRPPAVLSFDRSLVGKELELIRRQTSLASFRFGSQDYDRWAVVYGRIEINKDSAPRSKSLANEFGPAPAKIICSSGTMVVFLAN
jgi:hypothetical protein